MAALPPNADFESTPSDRVDAMAAFDEQHGRSAQRQPLDAARWIGWRLRALVAAALVGCLAMFLLIRTLVAVPALDNVLHGNDTGVLLLSSEGGAPHLVRALVGGGNTRTAVDTLVLHRSPRWLVDDRDRNQHAAQHDALAGALREGSVLLALDDGRLVAVDARERGAGGLGTLFWLAAALAMLLYLVTMVVLLVRPDLRNGLYAVMSLAQVGNLLLLAIESMPGLGWPAGFMRADHLLHSAFDLLAAAALVHVTGLHPRRLPGQRARGPAAWLLCGALMLALATQTVPATWWWTQAVMIASVAMAVVQLAWMQRIKPHPLASAFLRVCILALATLTVLSLSIAWLSPRLESHGQGAAMGVAIWVIFAAAMLLMLPFLSRTQQLMREFSLLAGVSTVATSLDLLFVAVFSLGSFASLTLALFIALGIYAGLRQWLLNRMLARERITAERMFEHLYRIVREVQAHPQSAGDQLMQLLRDTFEPLEAHQVVRRSGRSRVVADGARLMVPVPRLNAKAPPSVIILGYAQRGTRMFVEDDARLADRVIDQLSRAVAFDLAVERGRSEERVRIAQDLHDDIGARLLTLMYQAPTREMEDYLRHTLKDLKTLTRGLAAPSHRLSHAVAEWKADITQRMAAADCELGWSFSYDRDFELTVVQWSALTRVLRELVSNTIAHAGATRVDIEARLERGALELTVVDNGRGRNPLAWAHGLGLGGVRKRVKQLGGEVQWQESGDQGISCRVVIARLGPLA